MLSKTLKSSFSKYQVATSSVLTEITWLVLMCWQWAWQMKILMVSLQLTLWNLFCWHLSQTLGDHHAEEEQFNSFRRGLFLKYNGLKGLVDPCCSIFLTILVTGLQMASRAQLSSSTCQPGLSPSALGALLRPGDSRREPFSRARPCSEQIFHGTNGDIQAWEVWMWSVISSFDLFLVQRQKGL